MNNSMNGVKRATVPLIVVGEDGQSRYAATKEEAEHMYGTKITEALSKLGITDFRENQKEAVLALLSGKDCFICAATGHGKSLCFVLPAIILRGFGVVVSPLIALMTDQVESLRKKGIEAHFINSGQTPAQRKAVEDDIKSNNPKTKLLYVTPELIATYKFQEILTNAYQKRLLSLAAIDEAHAISEWGFDFRPTYRKLSIFKEKFPALPLIALTATATTKVRTDICNQLGFRTHLFLCGNFNRPNITYLVKYKDLLQDPLRDLIDYITTSFKGQCGIIYCTKREHCEEIAVELTRNGISSAPYHAGLSNPDRNLIQSKWKSGEIITVVATVAFGMGIDKSNIRYVIHMDIPRSIEGFYQESGRAGRDGVRSFSIIYYSLEDVGRMKWVISNDTTTTDNLKQSLLLSLDKMNNYCINESCRRKELLEYFGQNWTVERPRNAECCDICNPNPPEATGLNRRVRSTNARELQTFSRPSSEVYKRTRNQNGNEDLEVLVAGSDEDEIFPVPKRIASGTGPINWDELIEQEKKSGVLLSEKDKARNRKWFQMTEELNPIIQDRGNVIQISDMPPDIREYWFNKIRNALISSPFAIDASETVILEQAAELEGEIFKSSTKRSVYVSKCHSHVQEIISQSSTEQSKKSNNNNNK